MSKYLPDSEISEIEGPDSPWDEAEQDVLFARLLAHFDEEEDGPDNEPRCSYDEDLLAYWGGLRIAGWEQEEMLSQGLIDFDTYPFFEDEPLESKEPVPVPEILIREYPPEEIEYISF
jgi:hypothetical protein